MSKFQNGDKVTVDTHHHFLQGICQVFNGRKDSDGEIKVTGSDSDWHYIEEDLCTLVGSGDIQKDSNICIDIEAGVSGPNPYPPQPVAQQIQPNQEGNCTMANVTRNIVKVVLIDQDAGLDVTKSLVHDFGEHVVEGSIDDLKMQLAADNDIAGILAKHNAVRAKETNLDILNRTGNKVKLMPRKLSELTWKTSLTA